MENKLQTTTLSKKETRLQKLINLEKEINEKMKQAQQELKYIAKFYDKEYGVFVNADGTANNLTSKFVTNIYFTLQTKAGDEYLIEDFEEEIVKEYLATAQKLQEMETQIILKKEKEE